MALPTTREEFKQLCLRQLGKPVIDIEVADEQVEDAIDLALEYYADYHYDATDKEYYKILVTEQMKSDRYVIMPENIIGVVKIFPVSTLNSSAPLFNVNYQIIANDLLSFGTVQMVPLYETMTHIALIEQLLVGQQPIRYSRHMNRLYIDMDWNKVATGQYLVAECYKVIDPNIFIDVWKDRWLIKYTTAQIKKLWGNHLKKYSGMALPGGVNFNGQIIYDEAIAEILQMEADMIQKYALPVVDMIQ